MHLDLHFKVDSTVNERMLIQYINIYDHSLYLVNKI